MKHWQLTGSFGIEHLRLCEIKDPQPGPNEVLLQLHAAALNYRDLLMIRGKYNPRQPLPLVPLSDGVGTIVAVGENVTKFNIGERVAGLFAQEWPSGRLRKEVLSSTLGGPHSGMLTEQICLPETGVIAVPDYLSHVEAATLPCAALTAWNAVVRVGQVRPGERVLIQGSGGVSMFALQFAQLLGAQIIVLSSQAKKLEKLEKMGVWRTLNYREFPEWGQEVRRLCEGQGADLVVEVGGAGTLSQSMRALRPGGRIALIGVLAGASSQINMTPVLMHNLQIQGVFVGNREDFEAMNQALLAHRIQPVIDRVFPFEQAIAALEYLDSGMHMGKICISMEE